MLLCIVVQLCMIYSIYFMIENGWRTIQLYTNSSKRLCSIFPQFLQNFKYLFFISFMNAGATPWKRSPHRRQSSPELYVGQAPPSPELRAGYHWGSQGSASPELRVGYHWVSQESAYDSMPESLHSLPMLLPPPVQPVPQIAPSPVIAPPESSMPSPTVAQLPLLSSQCCRLPRWAWMNYPLQFTWEIMRRNEELQAENQSLRPENARLLSASEEPQWVKGGPRVISLDNWTMEVCWSEAMPMPISWLKRSTWSAIWRLRIPRTLF